MSTEAQTGIINMNDDKPEAITAMLDLLYTGIYDKDIGPDWVLPDAAVDLMENLTKHFHVYALADRVQIPNLKERARYCADNLVHHCRNLPGFCEAVKSAYSVAPPGESGDALRQVILEVCAERAEDLFNDPNEHFETFVDRLPDFAMELLRWQAFHYY
ncbi:hypothetical protein EG328_010070 [Venturia inaequalis]|uniref:BTB domain-containing protein n=1 Tax=Venturia inaequalis TaxID=5025 RepID=A0A8H3U8A0_VENIN|nr:hypothetical protein EG328_010070 [Venturia inaequalis]KAE9970861.1 hypothetical protein EG327_010135 [Venturia inaequalis]